MSISVNVLSFEKNRKATGDAGVSLAFSIIKEGLSEVLSRFIGSRPKE